MWRERSTGRLQGKASREYGMTKAPVATRLAAFCAIALVTWPAGAQAQDRLDMIERVSSSIYEAIEDLWPEELEVPGLRADLGVGLGFSPEYKGSDDRETSIVPLIRLQYGPDLVLTGYTLKYSAYRMGDLTLGGLARYQSGRKQDTHEALMGLGNIRATVAVGPFLQYRIHEHIRLFADMRHALGAGQGTRVDFGARVGFYKTEKFGALGAIRATWASDKYMRTFFGVTPQQSAASHLGHAVYRPGSGISEVAFSVGSRYYISDETSIVNFVEYGRLFGNAKDSPLVDAGSANQFTGGVGLLFSF